MSVQFKFQEKLSGKKNKQPDLVSNVVNSEETNKTIEVAGYSYDPDQDIFYSILNPWQRNVGYCHLYDEAAALWGMIVDSELVYFEYNGQKWMIGFWKGQYDLVTGGEIGIYNEGVNLKIPGILNDTFYKCATDNDLLEMSFSLIKKGKILFTREGKHWWLTGFKLGEFSQPSELTMNVQITLKDKLMRDGFIAGLKNAGYVNHEFTVTGNTVSFVFAAPRSPQPATRTPVTDRIIQKKNEVLCNTYQELTGELDDLEDKLRVLKEQAPEIYQKIFRIGKSRPQFKIYGSILLALIVLIGAFVTSRLINGQEPKDETGKYN